MKIISLVVLLFTCSFMALAKTTPKFKMVYCNQKYIPMKIEQSLMNNMLTVKFTAQRQIDQFVIKQVRGIEGVNVTKFQEQNVTNIKRGETLTSLVELSDFKGLVYVVFDVDVTLNGQTVGHSVPVALGSLSPEQKAKRSENIKEERTIGNQKGDALKAPPVKYHEMQVP